MINMSGLSVLEAFSAHYSRYSNGQTRTLDKAGLNQTSTTSDLKQDLNLNLNLNPCVCVLKPKNVPLALSYNHKPCVVKMLS